MALTKINNRMIDGASVNVQDFGAVGDGIADDTAAIESALNTGERVKLPSGAYRITRTMNLDSFNIRGEGELVFDTGSIQLSDLVTSVRMEGITLTGGSGIATTVDSVLSKVYISGITMQNSSSGIHLNGAASNVLVENSTWLNIHHITNNSCNCFKIGNNDYADSQVSNGIRIVNNYVDGVLNDYDVETHAFLIYGTNVVISGNYVKDVYHSFERACEAIYTKAFGVTISNNTIITYGPSDDGCINVKGGVPGDGTTPEGYDTVIDSNTITCTVDNKDVIGISVVVPNSVCSNNVLRNCHIRAFSTKWVSIIGNITTLDVVVAPFVLQLDNVEFCTVRENTFLVTTRNNTANTTQMCRLRNTLATAIGPVIFQDNVFRSNSPDWAGASTHSMVHVWAEDGPIEVNFIGNTFGHSTPNAINTSRVLCMNFSGNFDIKSRMVGNMADGYESMFTDALSSGTLDFYLEGNIFDALDIASNAGMSNKYGVTVINNGAVGTHVVYPEEAVPGAKVTIKGTHPTHNITVNTVGTGQFYNGDTVRTVVPGDIVNIECIYDGYWLES